ncbi:MAG: nucleotidyltransferase family protein [Anaerolineales bacterium]|nr:nucleotidyltransferase family protein [Anaerolineales bacterium]
MTTKKKAPTARPPLRKVAEATPKYQTEGKAKSSLLAKRISFSKAKISAFCKRWKISEFSLFGSVLREDFNPESDVDVLVNFQQQATWSLWDLMDMTEELEKMFGRKVDIVEKEAIRNPYRRHSIINGSEVFYAAK